MKFFGSRFYKIIAILFIFLISANCSPHIWVTPPDYPHSISSNSYNKFDLSDKITISLLPVIDSRNVPTHYVARVIRNFYYYKEPVSDIVSKAIQTELTNYGYSFTSWHKEKSKSDQHSNTIYLKVHILEFLADLVVKSFHTVKPIVITLNALLIDPEGNVIARKQFSHRIRPVRVTVGPISTGTKKHHSLLITNVLPKVLNDMMVWINETLSLKYNARDTREPVKGKDPVEKLEQLKEMKKRGLITEREYQDKKKEILKNF